MIGPEPAGEQLPELGEAGVRPDEPARAADAAGGPEPDEREGLFVVFTY